MSARTEKSARAARRRERERRGQPPVELARAAGPNAWVIPPGSAWNLAPSPTWPPAYNSAWPAALAAHRRPAITAAPLTISAPRLDASFKRPVLDGRGLDRARNVATESTGSKVSVLAGRSDRIVGSGRRRRKVVLHFGQRAFQAPSSKNLKSSCGDGRNNTSDVWTWPVTRWPREVARGGRRPNERRLARGEGQFGSQRPPEPDAHAIGFRSHPRSRALRRCSGRSIAD